MIILGWICWTLAISITFIAVGRITEEDNKKGCGAFIVALLLYGPVLYMAARFLIEHS